MTQGKQALSLDIWTLVIFSLLWKCGYKRGNRGIGRRRTSDFREKALASAAERHYNPPIPYVCAREGYA
jgi:hypothetical protein